MKKHLFASLAALSAAATLAAQERPNIVVFLVDDMGLMDTSVPFITDRNGEPQRQPLNDWYRTPNMERLAAQGICFSTFYAQSVSSPSRTSIMTGQNAARHRTTNWINAESNNRDQFGPYEWNWQGLKADAQIYPAVLKAAGYKTIHVGKAHFGCKDSEGEDPTRLGFDVNIAGSSIGHPGSYHGENGYGWIKGQRARAVPDLEQYHGTSTFLSDALTLEAEKEIDKAIAEGKPFYLNMAHYAVHAPFETDERFIGHYQNSDKPQQAKAFATLIEGMDKSLGDLLDKLEEAGVAENTLVIFLGTTADYLLGLYRPAADLSETESRFFGGYAESLIPVIGTVKAGYGALAFEEDYGKEYARVKDPANYFYLVVRGDSMEPRIQDGDLALVHRQDTLESGDLGVIIYGDEGEGTLKRYIQRGNSVVLQPFNPNYSELVIKGEDLNRLHIAGRVVETKTKW